MFVLLCPDCQTNATDSVCPSCGRSFLAIDGVINGLPKRLTEDLFKNTEQRFWNFAYASGPGIDHAPGYLEFHEHFLAPLKVLGPNAQVLEIAAGTRGDGLRLLEAGVNVVETDISLVALQKLILRHSGTKQSAVIESLFVAADAEQLPFPDQTFDGVFVAASFHHLPDPERGLKEMARVTKPGGLVIVAIEPNRWPYTFIYRPLLPIKRWIRARRARPVDSIADDTTTGFTEEGLTLLFARADLEVIEIRPVKFLLEFLDSGTRLLTLILRRPLTSPPWLQCPLARVDCWLGKIPGVKHLGWHWTIIGKKKL